MDKRSMKVLEYDTIVKMLEEEASSQFGKKKALNIKPLKSRDEVLKKLKETSESQSILLKKGSIPIGAAYEISPYVKRASLGGILEPYQFLRIADTLRTSRRIKTFVKDLTYAPIIQSLTEDLFILRDFEEKIENAIISEEEISDNASSELKRIRRNITLLKEQIRTKLQSIVSSSQYSKFLQESVVTMRQDRFVIPVKAENKSSVPGIVHDSSASGATLFIEPIAVVEMNNKIRELRVKEKEEIERILTELSNEIGEFYSEIKLNEEIIAEVDFISAKGKLSIKMKAQEPALNNELFLNFKNARHPLIPSKDVVPSNIHLGKKFNTLVITGPNTGGKTVTLKTVGLFALMAQSGLHLPCDYGTSICIFQNIFADIGDEQSIEQSLSTFSSHMTHIVNILKNVHDDSLVLFDELGAGTDPLEGAALAVSILEKLRNFKVLTIATTHYSELKTYALTTDTVENASVEFDINTLSPTYRLLIGIPGKSNAFEISRKLGLMEDIIKSATLHMDSDSIAMEDILKEIEDNRKSIEDERNESKKLLEETQRLKNLLEEKETKLEAQREKIISKAKKDAKDILTEAKLSSEDLIKELKELKEQVDEININKKIEDSRKKIKSSIDKYSVQEENLIKKSKSTKRIKELSPGDNVFVSSFGKEGIVVSIDKSKKEALIQIGVMKMNLPYSALDIKEKPEAQTSSSSGGKSYKVKSMDIKTEIDVRGMDLESARLEVDKYLDNVYISGIVSVTIIHGVGTMVLKNGLKDLLKKHKHVKSFRDGVYGEGGMGVTVVEIK